MIFIFLSLFLLEPSKESAGPYAWRGVSGVQDAIEQPEDPETSVDDFEMSDATDHLPGATIYPNGPKWSQCLTETILSSPRLRQIILEAASMSVIAFRLTNAKATAGRVLLHSIGVIESFFRKHKPMIFKFGYTHNPSWRWMNKRYGYAKSRDGWTNMLILYISDEPYSAAMLEAALIEKYQSNMVWYLSKVLSFDSIKLVVFYINVVL